MKILITGATGFIGVHLCQYLGTRGHQLWILARNQQKYLRSQIPGNVIKGELSYNSPNTWIKDLPQDLEVVIHLGGLIHSYAIGDFFNINALATGQLLEDLKAYSSLHFILISSLAAIGPTPVEGQPPLGPISAYGKSKKKAEGLLLECQSKGLLKTIIRPPIVLGPDDPAFGQILRQAQKGLFFYPAGGKDYRFSFISVFDLVKIIGDCFERRPDPRLLSATFIHPAYPRPFTFHDLGMALKQLWGKSIFLMIPIPSFLLWITSRIFAAIHLLAPRVSLPITPDKYREIIAHDWISPAISPENISTAWDLSTILQKAIDSLKMKSGQTKVN
ncbi:MAG: NAD-dependent epimerase/dehydratase family protein [Pseudomonadota bacterium]